MSGYGNPYISQVFGLFSSYNVGDFMTTQYGGSPLELDLTNPEKMFIYDGMSALVQLAMTQHPPLITASTSKKSNTDIGFLTTDAPWKWTGIVLRYELKVSDSDIMKSATEGTAGVYGEAMDWLTDQDNLGGAAGGAADGSVESWYDGEDYGTESFFEGYDDRGWVYVDNDDDGYGLESPGVIRGNIDPASITREYLDSSWINNSYRPGFVECTQLDLGAENPWSPMVAETHESVPYSTDMYGGTLFWQCQITNFYDTMMSANSMLSFNHLIGEVPYEESEGFWIDATGATVDPGASDPENAEGGDNAGPQPTDGAQPTEAVQLIDKFYVVNDNIILDWTDVSVLTPRPIESFERSSGMHTESWRNPAITTWWDEASAEDSYHGHLSYTTPTGESLVEEGRDTGEDGYSTPTLTLGPLESTSTTGTHTHRLHRWKDNSKEAEKYSAWYDSKVREIQDSLYASVGSKKFTVKMQMASPLRKAILSGMPDHSITYVENYASSKAAAAETTAATESSMATSPASVGSSGYGGY